MAIEGQAGARNDVGVVREGAWVGGESGEGLRCMDVVPDRKVVVWDARVWEGDGLQALGISVRPLVTLENPRTRVTSLQYPCS